MKVLVLGSGGREHALAWRLGRDPDVTGVVSAPGNPGIARVSRCVAVDLGSPDDVLALADRERVDLTVVGPEAPLERGVADLFRARRPAIVGPSRAGAALECSKAYAKEFMRRHGIPTARFVVCDRLDDALRAVTGAEFGFPVVVKADGLAGGKGVDGGRRSRRGRSGGSRRDGGSAVRRWPGALVIEECLTGPEVSFFVLADGERRGRALDRPGSQADLGRRPRAEHRRHGRVRAEPADRRRRSIAEVLRAHRRSRVVSGMRAEGEPYQGFLYVGLMLTPRGPKVIEFNVRFGDPEAQVVLPLIDGPLARTLLDVGHRRAPREARRGERATNWSASCLPSRGYPAPPETGQRDSRARRRGSGRRTLSFFTPGRASVDGRVVTAGGRVLTVVGARRRTSAAMATAYDAASSDPVRRHAVPARYRSARRWARRLRRATNV